MASVAGEPDHRVPRYGAAASAAAAMMIILVTAHQLTPARSDRNASWYLVLPRPVKLWDTLVLLGPAKQANDGSVPSVMLETVTENSSVFRPSRSGGFIPPKLPCNVPQRDRTESTTRSNWICLGLLSKCQFNWTTRGYANPRIANSRTGHLADWSTRGLDNSRMSPVVG